MTNKCIDTALPSAQGLLDSSVPLHAAGVPDMVVPVPPDRPIRATRKLPAVVGFVQVAERDVPSACVPTADWTIFQAMLRPRHENRQDHRAGKTDQKYHHHKSDPQRPFHGLLCTASATVRTSSHTIRPFPSIRASDTAFGGISLVTGSQVN